MLGTAGRHGWIVVAVAVLCTTMRASRARISEVNVLYSNGECNHATMVGHFDLSLARFDGEGSKRTASQITKTNAFMIGYVSALEADETGHVSTVYAAQLQSGGRVDMDVRIFNVSYDSTGYASQTRLLIDDVGQILQPCSKVSPEGLPPCSDADLFYPFYLGNDGDVLFGYRAWTAEGFPRGNQALALLRAKTSEIQILTYNETDVHTSDICPVGVPRSNDDVFFIREFEEGYSRSVAHVDLGTGRTTILDNLPAPSDWGGCLSFVDENTFVYIGDETQGEFGKKAMYAVNVNVSDDLPLSARRLFSVPLVNTPVYEDKLSLQYCTSIVNQTASGTRTSDSLIACVNYHDQISLIEVESGLTLLNLTMPHNKSSWDMTSYSYKVTMVFEEKEGTFVG